MCFNVNTVMILNYLSDNCHCKYEFTLKPRAFYITQNKNIHLPCSQMLLEWILRYNCEKMTFDSSLSTLTNVNSLCFHSLRKVRYIKLFSLDKQEMRASVELSLLLSVLLLELFSNVFSKRKYCSQTCIYVTLRS